MSEAVFSAEWSESLWSKFQNRKSGTLKPYKQGQIRTEVMRKHIQTRLQMLMIFVTFKLKWNFGFCYKQPYLKNFALQNGIKHNF